VLTDFRASRRVYTGRDSTREKVLSTLKLVALQDYQDLRIIERRERAKREREERERGRRSLSIREPTERVSSIPFFLLLNRPPN